MKEIEQLILFITICNCLEWFQQFSVTIQWSMLNMILKTNIEPANLGCSTTPYYIVPFIWYQKAISRMPGTR